VLRDHSLIHRSEVPDHPDQGMRFGMLETVREYAHARLATRGAADQLARRHANYFLELAQRANVGLQGTDQQACLAWLQVEHHNLHAALAWASEGHDRELAVSLAATIGQHYYRLHGNRRENARLIENAIAGRPQPSSALALALASLARLENHWDVRTARAHAEQAIAVAAELPDPGTLAWCSLIRATEVYRCGEQLLARDLFEETIELARVAGDPATEAYAVTNLANVLLGSGEYERVSRLVAETSTPIMEAGDPANQLTFTMLQAIASVRLGHENEARARLQASIPLVHKTPVLGVIGWLRACGVVLARAGNAERAARLLGQEEFLRERHIMSLDPTDVRELNDAMEVLNARLYPSVLASAWQQGRSMSIQDTIGEAAKELYDRPARDAAASVSHDLGDRLRLSS
jgi:hypothetical protein